MRSRTVPSADRDAWRAEILSLLAARRASDLPEPDDRTDQARQHRAALIARTREMRRRDCLPHYANASLDDLDDVLARDTIRAWCHSPDLENLYLHGTPGAGKTYAAQALLNEAAFDGVTTGWVREGTLLAHLHITAGDPGEAHRLAKVELLLIDELGGGALMRSDYIDRMAGFLDERHARGRRTIFTSNLTHNEFAAAPWLAAGTTVTAQRLANRIAWRCAYAAFTGNRRVDPAGNRARLQAAVEAHTGGNPK